MKKRILLLTSDEYITFVHRDDENKYYAVAQKEFEKVVGQSGLCLKEEKAPDALMIKAYSVGKVGEQDNITDSYDIISKNSIDFPVNKIKHTIIKLGGF